MSSLFPVGNYLLNKILAFLNLLPHPLSPAPLQKVILDLKGQGVAETKTETEHKGAKAQNQGSRGEGEHSVLYDSDHCISLSLFHKKSHFL